MPVDSDTETEGLVMKPVLLSADAEIFAYVVPDEVAEHLHDYCEEFLDWNTKESFTEVDFVNYLNERVFPWEKSWMVEVAGVHKKDVPKKYKDCPWFNF